MKFIDEVTIHVEAGHGGSGVKSFYREKYVPLGGPDGGNGGRGGSVILRADRNHSTLLDFHYRPRWKATDGEKGQGSRKDGRAGDDLLVLVPVGTQVFRASKGSDGATDSSPDPSLLVCDLDFDGAEFTLAQGGRGGKGNSFFKSPTNRTPEHFQPGEPGDSGEFTLSLKLVADVGLVGFPNAGKSTLISRISSARPKIADYPFTTLTPNLGVVRSKGGKTFVVADIPGLIPGAHSGKGLGLKFLKHVERTRLLVHLIDPLQLNEDGTPCAPIASWRIICDELRQYSPELAARPSIVVLSKIDAVSDADILSEAKAAFEAEGLRCLSISAVTGAGLEELLEVMAGSLHTEAAALVEAQLG
jgi:GTP-binding protein